MKCCTFYFLFPNIPLYNINHPFSQMLYFAEKIFLCFSTSRWFLFPKVAAIHLELWKIVCNCVRISRASFHNMKYSWQIPHCFGRNLLKMIHVEKNERSWQWRIQDFPDGGAPTSKVGAPTYYFIKFSPKTAWKLKNLDPEGGRASLAPPPPLKSANAWNTVNVNEDASAHHITDFVSIRPFEVTFLLEWSNVIVQ